MVNKIKWSIGTAISLHEYLSQCASNPDIGLWLVCKNSDERYSLDMLVYPIEYNAPIDMDIEEYEELEREVILKGYWNCMNSDQLADIMDNLKIQKSDYSDSELEQAVNYYSKNDCFIDINNT